MIYLLFITFNYNLFIYIRDIKIRTNLGKTYLLNTYINTINITNANNTWFTKKNGTNCGIFLLVCLNSLYIIISTLLD